MRIGKLTEAGGTWRRFNLNVGGFTIRNCYWNVANRRIIFPVRYTKGGRKHKVVFVYGKLVNTLRDLLESGEMETSRDRRPCALRIIFLGPSRNEGPDWQIFNFTVRGFTILGYRWQPSTGSVQLPVTFFLNETPGLQGYVKKRVVCAYGAHIVRLRHALLDEWDRQHGVPEEEAAPMEEVQKG